jgi:hypothetical protein
LPDEAVVVIGGLIPSTKKLARDARVNRDWLIERGEQDPPYCVSVCSLPASTAHEIARAATTERLPQTMMRVSTVADLRQYGYEVVPSGRSPHASLIFAEAPTDVDWNNLQDAFSEPEDNPVAERPRNA